MTGFVEVRDVNGAVVLVPETWVKRWPDRYVPVNRREASTPAVVDPAGWSELVEAPAGDVPEEE